VECAWWAVTGAVRWLLVSDGPGASLAGRAAAEALSRASVRCILSTGLCGALDARWKPGDVVHAAEVIDGQGTRWESLDPGAGTEPVRLLSVGRVAATIDEKRGLAVATGAAVVEMEAAAVAAEAARNGLPFYCLRAVSDGLEEELPMDFNRYRDSKGRFSRLRIAAACALRPWAVPALLRFDRQCRWSAGILGDYLVHARFA
jgi:adenosylhomocysteine nucleosidase